jgi:hypothetical protein
VVEDEGTRRAVAAGEAAAARAGRYVRRGWDALPGCLPAFCVLASCLP